jgi:uncharacterized alkaline shock family protein YloU
MAENNEINKFENGSVNISNEVLEIITTIATKEIEGVCDLYGNISDNIGELFKKNNYKKGIKVQIENGKVIVDLDIIVDFGVKIPDVSWTVQEAVKSSIENMTGLKVTEVNIHVEGIKEKKESN